MRQGQQDAGVYGTVLDKWLGAPSQAVLGRKFPALPII
jgi:hypothetical protein